jgi:hypothetical protein
MPWRCPACRTQIRHSEVEDKPRLNTAYRCHICRLELVLDPDTQRLTVSPYDGEPRNVRVRKTAKR